MKKKIIYLPLMGRIGNQLFQFAMAYSIQREYKENALIIIDESAVLENDWENSLKKYKLENVCYTNDKDNILSRKDLRFITFVQRLYRKHIMNKDSQKQFRLEKRWQYLMNKCGFIGVERGFMPTYHNVRRNVALYGYFQSERYFMKYADEIKSLFDSSEVLFETNYPHIKKIEARNSICISIKIEHNDGNYPFDVCHEDYYKKAISYIIEQVDNPLFFLCSDNVERSKELFFSDIDLEIVEQPSNFPAHLTLAAMSLCKHFIINNTSFGWWAQYLSKNEKKIVVAPERWKNTNDPVNIYDNQNWHLIECL